MYHTLKGLIKAKYGQDACNVGDEGGFAPNISCGEDGLELISAAIEKAGYTGRVRGSEVEKIVQQDYFSSVGFIKHSSNHF